MDKSTGFQLTRAKYKEIKILDHNKMTQFLANLYREGIAEGMKRAEGLNMDELKEAVLSVKGIGEKKAADIVAAVESKMNEKKAIEN